jgi:integron integrase
MSDNPTPGERVVRRTRELIRVRGYSGRTEEAYVAWIRRFLSHHPGIHPMRFDATHAEAFLEYLGEVRRLAPKTRNLAASAVAFLYAEVLGKDAMESVARAKGRRHVPVVLSRREVRAVLERLKGRYRVIASLMYGTGMRLGECLGLRLMDLDFELAQITVRDGKGRKDRYALFPERVQPYVRRIAGRVAVIHRKDREGGGGWAVLPGALHVKMPEAGWDVGWQFLFPARRCTTDPVTGRVGRHHLHESAVQRTMKKAVRESGILKRATCHTLRHSFASQLLRDGYDIRQVKDLLGHNDVRTTMIYLHAVDHTGLGIRSPIDRTDFGGDIGGPLDDD